MESRLFSLLPLFLLLANLLFVTETNSTNDPFTWLRNIFDKGISSIENFGSYLLIKIIEFLLFASRIVYITVGILGAILWLSHIQPNRGKRMVIGSLFLALVTELLKAILT
ncbi:MAG: hypothetical protein RQ952_06930 [Thermoproteota archaeon]|nr:hypothetical protein [Thermoproteota archaeon]